MEILLILVTLLAGIMIFWSWYNHKLIEVRSAELRAMIEEKFESLAPEIKSSEEAHLKAEQKYNKLMRLYGYSNTYTSYLCGELNRLKAKIIRGYEIQVRYSKEEHNEAA